MKINLETDEQVLVVIDGTCKFKVWCKRNNEGTMVIEHINANYTNEELD